MQLCMLQCNFCIMCFVVEITRVFVLIYVFYTNACHIVCFLAEITSVFMIIYVLYEHMVILCVF